MGIININKNILSDEKEINVTDEIIVPDTKPDVVSVVCSNGLWYVHKKEILNGELKLNGNVQIELAYLSGNGDTRGITTTLNFEYKLENSKIRENSNLKYDLKIRKIEAKILNERKIQIFAKLEVYSKIYEKQEIEINNNFDNIDGIQKKEENLEFDSIVDCEASTASIDEKIDIPNLDKILDILKTNIEVTNIESKMSYNKILAKAELKVFIIYLTEDERIEKVEASFPIMSFIEISNIKESDICNLDYKMKNIVLKVINNDTNGINCQIDFEIIAEAYEKKNIKFISDMYSLKSDLEFEKSDIEFTTYNKENIKIINIDEKIEISNIRKLLNVEISPIFSSSPEMKFSIFYEDDEKNILNVKEVKIPIMLNIDNAKEYNINILKNEFELEDNKVIVKSEVEINKNFEITKKILIIKEVKVNELENKDDYSVVIYFVKANDTLWEIAKKFKVSMESLVKINNLENPELIYPGDKLYVLK